MIGPRLLLACFFAFLLAAIALGGPITRRVSFEPPAGFLPSNENRLFSNSEAGVSIAVSEIARPVLEVSKGFAPEFLRVQGFSFLSEEPVQLSTMDGSLYLMDRRSGERNLRKWILVVGDERETAVVTATFPEEREESMRQPLRRVLESLTWDRKDGNDEWFEGLPFSLEGRGSFTIAHRSARQVTLTEHAVFPLTDPAAPRIDVSASLLVNLPLRDPEPFATMHLQDTTGLSDLTIVEREPIAINGLVGNRLLAQAKETDEDLPRFVYQAVLLTNEGYVILQGFSPLAAKDRYLREFTAVLESLEPRSRGES